MADRRPWPRRLLRWLPRGFRYRFGDECAETIDALAADAARRGGRLAQARYLARELFALGRLSLALRRERRAAGGITTGIHDVWWALRHVRREPGLCAAVIVTIALAVATAATAFGLASAVLWRPLPFDAADRLAFVWEEIERDGAPSPARVTGARYAAWREAGGDVAALAVFGAAGFTLDTPAGAATVRGARVSTNYFDVLGITPAFGRTFAQDDAIPGNERVVMLSTPLWREQFGGRTDAIGGTLRLSGQPYTVIGIMPPGAYPAWPVNPANVTLDPGTPEFWVPIGDAAGIEQNSRAHVLGVLARLRGGRNTADLLDRLNTATDAPDPHRARLEPFRRHFVATARAPLVALACAAMAVLLIACGNLAALQASAFQSRRVELAVRAALGAGTGRLVRQLLLEVLLLIMAGTIGGVLLARIGLARLPALLPSNVPLLTTPALDPWTLAFAALLAVVSTLLVSSWPVARLILAPPAPRGTIVPARSGIHRVLVVAQIALAVALTSAAGLLGRSLRTVERQDLGFSTDRVLVARIGLPERARVDARSTAAAEQQLLARLAAHPRVEAAAAAYDHPLEANWSESPTVTGDAAASDHQTQAELRIVSPGYFEGLDVALVEGRTLSDRDTFDAPGAAVVNEFFAQQFDGRVLGRRILSRTPGLMHPGAAGEFEIVGIVADERFRGLEQPPAPAYYLSTRQFPQAGFVLLVRTRGDPLAIVPDLRSAIRALDATITMDRVTSLDTILAGQLASRRVTTSVIEGFAGTALILAAFGMYGSLAVALSRRRREIGIRLAVGASPLTVARDVLRHALSHAAAGVLIGVALALLTGRLLHGLLVGVSVHDPFLLGATAIVLLSTGLAAAVIPAVRAARLDPSVVLRHE